MTQHPKPLFPKQQQPMPGLTKAMEPSPGHGERSYKGSGRLAGKKAIITGGDSGIGRAVAIAYAREGADLLISYLNEGEEAWKTKRLVEECRRTAVLVPGDIKDAKHCRIVVDKAVADLGGIDILVNNAPHQASFKEIEEISDEEWGLTFKVNVHAMFYLTKAAVSHMKVGGVIINAGGPSFKLRLRGDHSRNRRKADPVISRPSVAEGLRGEAVAGISQLGGQRSQT